MDKEEGVCQMEMTHPQGFHFPGLFAMSNDFYLLFILLFFYLLFLLLLFLLPGQAVRGPGLCPTTARGCVTAWHKEGALPSTKHTTSFGPILLLQDLVQNPPGSTETDFSRLWPFPSPNHLNTVSFSRTDTSVFEVLRMDGESYLEQQNLYSLRKIQFCAQNSP